MSKIVLPHPELWTIEPVLEAKGNSIRLYRFDASGLEGLYNLNGNVADGSGKGRGGTAYDVTYEGNSCAVFNGSSSYASLPYDFGSSAVVSVSFRIYISSWPSTDKGILSSAPNLGASRLYIGIQGGTGKLFCLRGGIVYSALPLTVGGWRHVVVVSDGTTTSFYIDNVHAGSFAQTAVYSAQTAFYIGRGYHGYLNGKIDALFLFSRALTVREREYLYNAGAVVETIPYASTSPVAESPWIALRENELSDSPADIRENIGAELDGYTAGSIDYQYALNGGAYNGSYLALPALNSALKGQAITDHSNSLRLKARLVGDGAKAADISGLGVDFERIEERIIEALKRLSLFKTVETYGGQAEDEIEKLPVRFPAAYVAYKGSEPDSSSGPDRETAVFSVMVAAKNLNGGEAARKGGAGAYELIKGVLDALAGGDLGLGIERLKPVRVSIVNAGATAALYSIEFRTGFERRCRYD